MSDRERAIEAAARTAQAFLAGATFINTDSEAAAGTCHALDAALALPKPAEAAPGEVSECECCHGDGLYCHVCGVGTTGAPSEADEARDPFYDTAAGRCWKGGDGKYRKEIECYQCSGSGVDNEYVYIDRPEYVAFLRTMQGKSAYAREYLAAESEQAEQEPPR